MSQHLSLHMYKISAQSHLVLFLLYILPRRVAVADENSTLSEEEEDGKLDIMNTGLVIDPAEISRGIRLHSPFFHLDAPVPESFDARERWPQCKSIGYVFDQGECGICWAIATATVLSDRYCIKTKGNKTFQYSIEDLVSCCAPCTTNIFRNPCVTGGDVTKAMRFVKNMGVVSGGDYKTRTGCRPLSAETTINFQIPSCLRQCTNKEYPIPYLNDKKFCRGFNKLSQEGVLTTDPLTAHDIKQAQLEIMDHGSIIAYMSARRSFRNFRSTGIYKNCKGVTTSSELDHAIKLIGWGNEDGTPYWIGVNSWGPEWGDEGFFKILRGSNTANVEMAFIAPIVNSVSYLKFYQISIAIVCSLVIIFSVK